MNTLIISRLFIPVFSVILMTSCSKKDAEELVPLPYTEGTVRIAKWKDDKKAALLIQFDDSTPGQATLGVPAMSKRGLIGTWYVNPGGEYYLLHKDIWENEAPAGNQELANHTMTHTGASSYDEVVYEVGEASKAIWRIRKEEDFASLIAFNRGGGTSWNEDDLKKVLEEYKNIDRLSYTGVKIIAKTIPIGSNADAMYELIPIAIEDSIICSIHFHGISDDNDGDDYGNGAVWVVEFEKFLDKVLAIKDEVWNTGYISMYKYSIERNNASVELVQYSNVQYGVKLSATTDDKYYNESLTILVYLPADWEKCEVNNDGSVKTYTLTNGVLMFNAVPNKSEVMIVKK
ncbi:MAG: hypothetical protein L3J74_05720 [Bacteroidales bacterium]|nr:hypothetical protein [Bacteroidales bacterium]